MKPQPVYKPNLLNLIEVCEKYVQEIEEKGLENIDDNWDAYITDKALEAIFGKEVFEWILKQSEKEE